MRRHLYWPALVAITGMGATFWIRAQSGATVVRIPGVAAESCRPPSGEKPWLDRQQTPSCRALEAIAQMTFEEKLNFRGSLARLGLNAPPGQNGPNGIAGGWNGPLQPRQTHVTAFPNVVTLAASWDRDLARRYGIAIGEEFAGKGMSSVTGPTINLMRTWHWGRAAETFGEDPYLMGELAAPEVLGIQSQRVIAVVKHFAGNNQENTRTGVYPDYAGIDERITGKALHEIYFPHFRAAVERAHNGAVMCAYNQINGRFSCNDPELLGQLRQWGFDGYIVPDAIYAQRSVAAAAKAGVDRVQGASELGELIHSGALPAGTLDAMVFHLMVPNFRLGIYDVPPAGKPDAPVSTPQHLALSREVASQGVVLLKNEGSLLPLAARSIAVIGDDAGSHVQVEEAGSAHVNVERADPPLDAIRLRAGNAVKVTYARGTLGIGPLPAVPSTAWKPANGEGQGLAASYFPNADWSGAPVVARVDPTVDFADIPAEQLNPPPQSRGVGGRPRAIWSARWSGVLMPPSTGIYRFSVTGGGTAQLYVNHQAVVTLMRADFPMTAHGLVELTAAHPVEIELKYSSASNLLGRGIRLGWQPPDPAMLAEAVSAAKQADVAIVCAAEEMGEGHDKLALGLPGDQDRLIEAVARANPRTVVVLHTSNPVAMPWLDQVAAVVEAWYPGQEAGASLAAVLFGDMNPSGRLPITFPASEQQGPAQNWTEYPGDGKTVNFTEGVFVGYRWYDAKGQQPLFPFGFGLSYTTFVYSGLRVERGSGASTAMVSVRLRNTGRREGAEVAQLYLSYPPEAQEPPRQLKGFLKVRLKPGASQVISMPLDEQSFSAWDESVHKWRVYPGTYKISVGSSSRDLRAQAEWTR